MGKSNVLLRGRKKRAQTLVTLNRLEDARALYIEICRKDQRDADAWGRLGRLNWRLGRLDDAEACCRKAIGLGHDHIDAYSVLGLVCMASGRLEEAEDAFRRVLQIDATRADAYNNLGHALGIRKRADEAVRCLRNALRLQPDAPEIHNNLGHALRSLGLMAESEAAHRRAVELQPASPEFYSNWLLSLNYLPETDPQWVLQQHEEWARRFTRSVTRCTDYSNSCDPTRVLRVGYVSPDFQQHPVACFIEPILAHHDSDLVEVICYADVSREDAVTERLRGLCGTWRMVRGMEDEKLVELIRSDGVDVLIDLAGHTANNRLLVFAARPAPVQVSYLGYCNTTGLAEIDYRISDAIADPPGSERLYTEELVLLDSGFSCYAPPRNAAEVSEPPVDKTDVITFGSMNMLGKLNAGVIALWSEVLRTVPGSRLLIYRDELQGSAMERFRELFVRQGISDARIELRCDLAPDQQYLSVYKEIDIALDTFPWNGHTTACEALWMGVPVVTLAGETHSGRMCASVLTQLGLSDLVAENLNDYIRIAAALAADRERLRTLRRRLRSIMTSSTATGGNTLTGELECAYAQMWERWCAERA